VCCLTREGRSLWKQREGSTRFQNRASKGRREEREEEGDWRDLAREQEGFVLKVVKFQIHILVPPICCSTTLWCDPSIFEFAALNFIVVQDNEILMYVSL